MRSNIILIGFMGVGKSEIGKALAKKLGMQYLDTDSLIEKKENKTISDIFRENGEAYFRDLETKVLSEICETEKHVISTGGGIILKEENVGMMKKMGPLVLLVSSADIIEKRLSSATNRPLIEVKNRGEHIRNLLEKRSKKYQDAADYSFDTSKMNVSDAVEHIIKYYRSI